MATTHVRDDVDLLLAIASSDMEAISEFYRRHEARVMRYAMSKLSDSFAAADILNEVMLEVWKSAARFQGRAKVTTWLLGIAHNKVVDHYRKKGGREYSELDEAMPDDSPHADPEQMVSSASDSKLLHTCIDKLSSEHREILHLVFFEELGYSEISAIIQVPEGTVKSRVFHARNLLKKQLAYTMRSP
ncbi:MAG: RNA polymerase sigma-70 factor (ECF subfamily) [Lentisphaeria bacterium]|jgi:RNA polymerase sigma-70 factor (ECF subfamily)